MYSNPSDAGRARARSSLAIVALLLTPTFALAIPQVSSNHQPAATHLDQLDLNNLVAGGFGSQAFTTAFDAGSDQFSVNFNVLDGVGANVGNGQLFTRVPRADLNGPGQWANHIPYRPTGPNAQSCESCHSTPGADGGGPVVANVIRDPLHSGSPGSMIQRNTPHTFAPGAVQRLAEEMTLELWGERDAGINQACQTGLNVVVDLKTKGVSFGSLTVLPSSTGPCVYTLDTASVRGIDADLIVRPFDWKGDEGSLRAFSRRAFNNELGMQPIELTGPGVDGDFDGVLDEITAGDMTAMTIYLAAQPRPTSKLELAGLGLIDPLTPAEVQAIQNGQRMFRQVGCTACHVPSLKIANPIYSEPSQVAAYRDALLPSGAPPSSVLLDPARAVTFDLTADQPDNQIVDPISGALIFHLGALAKDAHGRAVAELYGDLKRHDVGAGLAESIDEVGTGASVFLTENLWGVGSTAPYLHDGRATTLTEAILAHGGEARAARDAFAALPTNRQQEVIAFLDNLVLFVNE